MTTFTERDLQKAQEILDKLGVIAEDRELAEVLASERASLPESVFLQLKECAEYHEPSPLQKGAKKALKDLRRWQRGE